MVPVTVGTILNQTFAIFFRGLGTLVGISLVVHTPVLLGSLVFFFAPLPQGTETLVQYGSSLFFTPLATAALVHAVFQLSREREASVGAGLRVAFSRFWAVVGLTILLSLIYVAGLLACCVPGFIAYAGLFVAMPVLIVERSRVGQTFDRSWNLTTDYKLTTFGTAFVLWLISVAFAAFFIVAALAVLGVGLGSFSDPAAMAESSQTVRGSLLLLQLLLEVPLTALGATAAAVAYYQLRQLKEGLGEHELLAVFE